MTEQAVDREYHYWFLVVKVIGPQPHQIKERNINMRTPEAKFNKVDYQSALQHVIKERAEELNVPIDQFEGVIYGPHYSGHMTHSQFEGNVDEHNGSEQG